MKVIFITLGFYPFRNSGFDISGERYVKLLVENDLDVTVIAGGISSTVKTDILHNLKIIRLPIGRDNWISYSLRASKVAEDLEGVKHFWDIYLAYPYHKQFVASLHQSFRQRTEILNKHKLNYPFSLTRKLYYFFAMQFAEIPSLRRSRYLFPVSITTKMEYANNYNINKDKLILARHYIDTEFFSRKRDVSRLRSLYGLKENIPIVLFVGFINQRKGIELLFRAIEKVNIDIYLLVIGKWQSENYRRLVLSEIAPHLREKIIEVGYVSDELMPYFYSLADIYVTTSFLEGFGLPIAEALACETPVIALDSGATKEVLGPGGILLPEMEINAMADAILSLIADKSLIRKLGELGRHYIITEFNKVNLLQSVMPIYKELS